MVSLPLVLEHLFPDGRPLIDWELRDDGGGPYIAGWRRPEPQPTPAEIEAARLPAAKAARIERINDQVRERLVAQYGDALEQVSRAAGIYGAQAQANHSAGVQATIVASNNARDAVNAAATVAAVEAVAVAWPVLP